jgi:hypothetical protein
MPVQAPEPIAKRQSRLSRDGHGGVGDAGRGHQGRCVVAADFPSAADDKPGPVVPEQGWGSGADAARSG